MKRVFGLVVGVLLGFFVFSLMRRVLNLYYSDTAGYIVPLSRRGFGENPTERFRYYYEPDVSYQETDFVPDWMSMPPLVTINDDTLNDRYTYSIPKPEHTFRIIALGDSWTFGKYVSTSETYPEILEDLLNNHCHPGTFEVLNLGVPGYDLSYSAQRLFSRGMRYEPDFVLWLLLENDFVEIKDIIHDLSNANTNVLGVVGPSSPEAGAMSVNTQEQVALWRKTVDDQFSLLGANGVRKFQRDTLAWVHSFYPNPMLFLGVFEHPLDRDMRTIVSEFAKLHPSTAFYQLPGNLHRINGILPDGHPNATGHKRMALHILRYLQKSHAIPCGALP